MKDIDYKESYNGDKQIGITPEGFWTNVIKVHKGSKLFTHIWEEATISWSSGGSDGSLTDIQTAHSFEIALKLARKIAKNLDKKYLVGTKCTA